MYTDETHLCSVLPQPRIDTAERQRGANNPRPLTASEAAEHPGAPAFDQVDRIQVRRSQISVMSLKDANEAGWAEWPISASGAPWALLISDADSFTASPGDAVWGLAREMTVEEAWSDYDHADEYEVVD